MSIRILDPGVVNRIAAGEVLERPANLIKELIENSLDAGADRIDVDFANGGREVVVRDNGRGMLREDLKLALERHATSKIVASEDLYRLASFGFRGEALASVAAVSHLTLTSRPADSVGARLSAEFGRAEEPVEISAKPGTEVRVRDLFENVPARRRFLKSDAAEHAQIKTTLRAIALARPDVGFTVRSAGELLFAWGPTEDRTARALEILPARRLFAGSATVDGITADVLVASPDDTQKVSRHVWCFVRGRWVQDRALVAAVTEGYRNLLMHGEYPVALVEVSAAPEEVDVNVHPTKAQVKFRNPSAAFRAVCRATREVLERAPWLEHAPRSAGEDPIAAAATPSPHFVAPPPSEPATQRFAGPEFDRTQFSRKSFPLAQIRENVAFGSVDAGADVEASPAGAPLAPANPALEHFRWADLQVIGQLNQTYIVAQSPEAFYLVDQHAAHERVVFERLVNAYRAGRMEVQELLLPLTFDFSLEETEALHDHASEIEKAGLTVERLGPESIAVRAMPAFVTENAVSDALQRLGRELTQHGGSLAWERALGDVFATMACHSVIRAGQPQSVDQMRALLAQMDEHPLSSFCPHGRPVFVRRGFREVEREFGRIT